MDNSYEEQCGQRSRRRSVRPLFILKVLLGLSLVCMVGERGAVWLLGRLRDPEREEAYRFQREVVVPFQIAMKKADLASRALVTRVERRELSPGQLGEAVRRDVVPLYRQIAEEARRFLPATPGVVRPHAAMVEDCGALVEGVEQLADALSRSDGAGVQAAQARVAQVMRRRMGGAARRPTEKPERPQKDRAQPVRAVHYPRSRPLGLAEVEKTVGDIVAGQLGVARSAVRSEVPIGAGGLGADELDIVELVMALEETFDIEIPDERVGGMRTAGEASRMVMELRVAKERGGGATPRRAERIAPGGTR